MAFEVLGTFAPAQFARLRMNMLQDMLARAGAKVPARELHRRKPWELSLAEKWALGKIQPGLFPTARAPSWLRKYVS